MRHVRLPYRIVLSLGILSLVAAACGGGGEHDAELAALRAEVAQIKQTQADIAKSLDALTTSKGKVGARPIVGAPTTAGAAAVPPQPLATQPAAPKREVVHRILINDAPRKGNEVAIVTVVEFVDFQSPSSQANAGLGDQLLKEFPNDVQIAFKHAPLGRPLNAAGAAMAAWAAKQQGKFWEMYDLIFAGDIKNASAETLRGYAQQLGLDMERFDADRTSKDAQKAVGDDKRLAKIMKIWGTPSYFVNGRRVTDRTPAGIRAMIASELAKARGGASAPAAPAS